MTLSYLWENVALFFFKWNFLKEGKVFWVHGWENFDEMSD